LIRRPRWRGPAGDRNDAARVVISRRPAATTAARVGGVVLVDDTIVVLLFDGFSPGYLQR
jgi:hypothetical protein